MKSILKKTALIATLFALGTGAVAPRKSHAFVAIHGSVQTSDPFQMMAGLTLCVLLLPFCILDERIEGTPSVTPQDLADNGYSDDAIRDITIDFEKLQSEAAARSLRIEVRPEDTRESLAQDIRSIVPDASDTFVEFYTRQATAR